jgi:hypothetical protein
METIYFVQHQTNINESFKVIYPFLEILDYLRNGILIMFFPHC